MMRIFNLLIPYTSSHTIKFVLFIYLSSCLVQNITAQDYRWSKDSLQRAFYSATVDSVKAKVLMDIAGLYAKTNSDTCILLAKQALELSQKANFKRGKVHSLNVIGLAYYRKNDYRNAILYYEQVKADIDILAPPPRCGLFLNLGNIYMKQANYPEAIEAYQKALKIGESIGNKQAISICLNNIGNIYEAQKDDDLALKYYEQSLKIKQEQQDKKGISATLNNIGNIYKNKKKYPSSLEYYKSALKIQEELNDTKGIAMTLNNIGAIANMQKKYDIGLEKYKQGLTLKEKVGDKLGMIYSLNGIAEIYQNRKEYDESIKYAQKALFIAKEIKALREIGIVYQTFYKTYRDKNDYSQALNYYELYKQINDSIFNIAKAKQIAELQTAFEVEKKEIALEKQKIEIQKQEMEIKALAKENRNKVFALLGLGVLLIILGIGGYLFYKNRQVIAKYNLLQTEQQVYRLQMNPHFFFNALVAIQDFVVQADGLKASSYISKFARLMRQTLEQSQQEFTSLSSEIETIKYYLDLQRLRFNSKFQYEITVDENLEIDDIQIPIMLMQPVIENAIEHGLKESNNGKITISFSQKLNKMTENLLQITISDNGIGRNKASQINTDSINIPQKHHSMATKILASRKELLRKQANFNLEIEITDKSVETHKESGTIVCFSMPLKYI
ncbi:MAG: tetratricopeptide repeat protein [Cytophagales bacterium]|nr:MAG: tetratricopeptide repeat protein [Cytophagales bacterium]